MDIFEKEPISLYLSKLIRIEDYYSEKQHIQFFQHPWMGYVLVINGEIQHVENYQVLYHELLVHLSMAFIAYPHDILILGGGSLFAASEVLKYPSVKNLVLCDYDHSVLNLMSKYYKHARVVLDDPRFHYQEEDARKFISATNQTFDLVINDCFNLAAESDRSGLSAFSQLSKLCTKSGICVDIIYRHVFDRPTTIRTLSLLHQECNMVLSLVVVPEYPGILHLETIWGNCNSLSQDAKMPINDYQLSIVKSSESPFLFYSPQYLPYYLYLPPYIKQMLNQ